MIFKADPERLRSMAKSTTDPVIKNSLKNLAHYYEQEMAVAGGKK